MTDLSSLSGEERKSDFGAIRSVDDPLADFSPADTCGYNRAGLRPTECQDADGARLASSLHFPHRRLILVLRRSETASSRSVTAAHILGIVGLRYLFEDYAFDTDRRELRCGAAVVSIAPQVFDLLDYLIRNRERVVSKDELINAIWNGRIVSDAALTTRLNIARSAIRDSGEEQRLIKTLPRKGFRFVGTVVEVQERECTAVPDNPVEPPNSALTLPDKPSIAVLPFQNMSGDPNQDYFADGMVDEITTALSRFKSLFVIARNSSFTYKGKAVDIKQIGRELGVRYVLEGSVRKVAGKVRIIGQLIDAGTGVHLWADRFEGDLGDVFTLQDRMTESVVSAIEPKVFQTEIDLAAHRTNNANAYDLCLRATPHLHSFTRGGSAEALRLVSRALESDPRYAFAATLAGSCHLQNITQGWAAAPGSSSRSTSPSFSSWSTIAVMLPPVTISMRESAFIFRPSGCARAAPSGRSAAAWWRTARAAASAPGARSAACR